jgi:hypothetical protein
VSGIPKSNETRGAAAGSAERGQPRGSAVTTKDSGKKTYGVTKAPVCATAVEPANTGCVQQSEEDPTARRVSESRVAPESPEDAQLTGRQDVSSVAELAVTICADPDNRKKRLKLAEALRERGLDEGKTAAMYVGLAEKLSRNKDEGAVGVAAAKLLFDVLKELGHRLEPQKTTGDSDTGAAPQFVRLIHNVPRPVRTE